MVQTKEDLSKRIIDSREHHESIKEKTLQEKSDAKINLDSELKNKMLDIVKRYEDNSDIEVIWNTDKSTYDAVTRV